MFAGGDHSMSLFWKLWLTLVVVIVVGNVALSVLRSHDRRRRAQKVRLLLTRLFSSLTLAEYRELFPGACPICGWRTVYISRWHKLYSPMERGITESCGRCDWRRGDADVGPLVGEGRGETHRASCEFLSRAESDAFPDYPWTPRAPEIANDRLPLSRQHQYGVQQFGHEHLPAYVDRVANGS